jgi:hypothetical protein
MTGFECCEKSVPRKVSVKHLVLDAIFVSHENYMHTNETNMYMCTFYQKFDI